MTADLIQKSKNLIYATLMIGMLYTPTCVGNNMIIKHFKEREEKKLSEIGLVSRVKKFSPKIINEPILKYPRKISYIPFFFSP